MEWHPGFHALDPSGIGRREHLVFKEFTELKGLERAPPGTLLENIYFHVRLR
jgi:hypothetical protein